MNKIKNLFSHIKNIKQIKSIIFYKHIPQELEAVKNKPYVLIASFGHSGFYTKAPGTFASFLTFVVAVLLYRVHEYLLLIFAIASLIAGFWAVKKMVTLHNVKDPSYIVIDEVVGMLIPLLISADSITLSFAVFIIFRFFDITKVSFIKTAEENLEGEKGIMADDIVAGCFTLFTLVFLSLFIV